MIVAERHADHALIGSELYVHGHVGAGVVVVAELSARVETPALHGATIEPGARMLVAHGDGGDAFQALNLDRDVRVGVAAVAQLSLVVAPPALHAAADEGAGVPVASCDRVHVYECDHRREAIPTRLLRAPKPPSDTREAHTHHTVRANHAQGYHK